jgi:hypothetical protein
VADAANGKAEPPPALEIIWGCQRYGCLPENGGYLDQDYRLMRVGTVYDNVYSFIKRNRNGGKRINYADLSDSDRDMFDWLRGLEIRY